MFFSLITSLLSLFSSICLKNLIVHQQDKAHTHTFKCIFSSSEGGEKGIDEILAGTTSVVHTQNKLQF